MTHFQLVAAGVFVVLFLVAYSNNIVAALASLFGRVAAGGAKSDAPPSIAVTIVNDLIAVTKLRDKLAAEDCPEGVDACTALLRVIVEHTKKPVA